MIDYTILLKENNLKATFQRISILEVVDKYGHMSVDDIYEELIKSYPSLSLATVYKNIILMVEKSVIVEVPIAGKKSKYELSKTDHIHLICTKCGLVEDKSCEHNSNEVFNQISLNESFTLSRRQVNLYGICKNC